MTVSAIRRGSAAEVVDVRHVVLRPGRPRETAVFAGDDHPLARHWVAIDGGAVVGVATIVPAPMPDPPVAPPPAWQLRGMAVLPAHRGLGLGARLLEAAQQDLAAPAWCNAREAVEAFYAAHGWRAVGPLFEIAGVGPHRRMWWPGA